MANPTTEPTFSMKVAEGVYLDNLGNYSKTPPGKLPIYELGGGMISLTPGARDDLISGKTALIFNAAEPSWKPKLRGLGFGDNELAFFGKVGDLVGSVATVIGWWDAGIKVAKLLGILDDGPSLEKIASEILQRVELLETMEAEGQEHNVKLWLDTSRAVIDAKRGQVHTQSKQLENLAVTDHMQRRQQMIGNVNEVEQEVRSILSASRWQLFFLGKHYEWAWGRPVKDNKDADWLPVPLDHGKVLQGTDWVDMQWPAPNRLRFDYRAALPHAVHAIVSYLAMLAMAEPEYRSTMLGRPALEDFAERLREILEEMRKVLVRTVLPAWEFGWEIAAQSAYDFLGQEGLVRPFGAWKVGATDLCSGADSYYAGIASRYWEEGQTPPSRLATLDWDWVPDPVDVEWHPPRTGVSGGVAYPGYWKIVDPQLAANQANAQSEADYAILLQTSGYLELARLEATLRHLATDPDESETVTGNTDMARHYLRSERVTIQGYHGPLCDAEEVQAMVGVDRFQVSTTVHLKFQPPDHPNQLHTRLLLVALTDEHTAPWAQVLSEKEIDEGEKPVTLASARTFDWCVKVGGPAPFVTRPTQASVKALSPASMQTRSFSPVSPNPWQQLLELPLPGFRRNEKDRPITLRVNTGALIETATTRERHIVVATQAVTGQPQPMSFRHVYLVVEETLASGRKLRTYFDVSMQPALFWIPKWFLDQEAECLRRIEDLVDHIDEHYSESVVILPPHVPVTSQRVLERFDHLRAQAPELVARVVREMREYGGRARDDGERSSQTPDIANMHE